MTVEKQVTIIAGLSQLKEQNARIISAEMTLSQVYEGWPDFKKGNFKTVFNAAKVQHVVVCIFENTEGRPVRRAGGLNKRFKGKKELMEIVKDMTDSLGITITRSREIHSTII